MRLKGSEQVKQRKPEDRSLEITQSDEKKKKMNKMCNKVYHCISNYAEQECQEKRKRQNEYLRKLTTPEFPQLGSKTLICMPQKLNNFPAG